MGQTAPGDVGINALIGAGLGVVLAPEARIECHHLGACTGIGGDALQPELLFYGKLVPRGHIVF